MNGASSSGFWAPGPPAITSVSSGPRSSAWSAIPPRSSIVKHIRVADLVLERKAQDVELAERRERLEAVERQAMLLEQRALEVGQRRERPLAGPAGRVHQAVEHLEPVMAHPQGVGVGKRQADGSSHGPVVLGDAVELAADVLAGRSDVGQDPRNDERLSVPD